MLDLACSLYPSSMIVPLIPPIDVRVCDHLLEMGRDRLCFLVGQADSPPTEEYYRHTLQRPYYCFPFGSSGAQHGVEERQKYVAWTFAGGKSHRSNWNEYIPPLTEKSHDQGLTYFLLDTLPDERKRIVLVDWLTLMNSLYPISVVCPNLHCPEQKRPGIRQDANQRLFDLAAVGACQVVDWFPLIDEYFEDDEVVKAKSPEEWGEKVLWYVRHSREAAQFGERAQKRWKAEHTWDHRAQQLRQWVKENR